MIEVLLKGLPFLWQGLLVTLQASAIVVAVALAVGVILGVGLSYGPPWIAWPIRLLSDFVRGLPLLVLIFSIFYMLPLTGWQISRRQPCRLGCLRVATTLPSTRASNISGSGGRWEMKDGR